MSEGRSTMRLARGIAGGVALLASLAVANEDAPAPAAAVATVLPPTLEDRVFEVYIDEREVGDHAFRFEGEPGDFRVRSEAEFEVKIAFITVFSYDHEATEHWVDGCMITLESETDSNEDFRVRGELSSGGFSMDAGDGGQTYDVECPWGFAYWNPGMRDRELLINPQDGKLFEVECREMEPQPLSVGARSVQARTWSLRGEDLDITLYYDDEDRWIGLDTAVEGGRMLRYRPHPSDPFYPG